MKKLWRGFFNYSGAVEKPLYRYAHTKRQAWKIMCDSLAKKHGVHPSHVYGLFDGSRNNYEITIEIDFREGEG